jgi:hypothetical protein
MAADPDARDFTLNYEGGSLTMPLGNLKDIFGDDFEDLSPDPVDTKVTVSQQTRVRVIGGSSTTILPYTYTYKQWPTSESSNSAAGKVCIFKWKDSDGDWQGRVSGSMAALGSYLNSKSPKTINFRTERGTKYGPFKKGS